MITWYHGIDVYRIRAAIADLLAHAPGASVSHVDAVQVQEQQELERSLKYPALFQEPSYVVVRNIFADADTAQAVHDILKRYTAERLADITVIACHEGNPGRPSAALKDLTKYLEKNAKTSALFPFLQDTELQRWMIDFCASRQRKLPAIAASALVQRIGHDSWALANELEKLCAYAEPAGISVQDVQTLAPDRQERDEYELSNAVGAHDKRGAITALWRRLHEGTSNQLLVGSLAHAIRTILSVGDLVSRRMPAAAIAKTTGIHPFVVSKTIQGAASYHPDKLQTALGSLAQLDRDTKGGTRDASDGLFSILLDL